MKLINDPFNLQTAAAYFATLGMCGSPCETAQYALIYNSTCVNATDAATICMGTCRALYDDVINYCDATVVSEYSQLPNILLAFKYAIAMYIASQFTNMRTGLYQLTTQLELFHQGSDDPDNCIVEQD